VVAFAQIAESAMPKRTSLPSMLPPDEAVAPVWYDWSTPRLARVGLPVCSAPYAKNANEIEITAIAANIAQPCFVLRPSCRRCA